MGFILELELTLYAPGPKFILYYSSGYVIVFLEGLRNFFGLLIDFWIFFEDV